MKHLIARAVGVIALAAARLVTAVLQWSTREMEATVGQKEDEALKALDEALDRVEAWANADDETDAARLKERTERLNRLVPVPPAQSHFPLDARTGERTQPDDLGPASPATSAPETSQPSDNAPVQPSESRSSTDPA